jgi:TM2 domain-containing membrane protein YozV
LVKDEAMVSNVICGRCGTLLDSRDATCRTCGAAAYVAVARPRKSRWVAAGLAALIPGLGHIYLGHYPKGLLYLAGASGLTFLGLDLDLTMIGAAVGVPMELGAIGLWLHGVMDAYKTAQRLESELPEGRA